MRISCWSSDVCSSDLFLMGDNRDGSADSRVDASQKGLGGPVPFDAIAGRAEIISFSTDGTAEWYNPLSWLGALRRSEEHTSELQSLMRISYAVFCLKKKTKKTITELHRQYN